MAGRPKNGRNSRTTEAMTASKDRYRSIHVYDNTDRIKFERMLTHLGITGMTKKRITDLNKFRYAPTERYVTYPEEISMGFDQLYSNNQTIVIWEPGCGHKHIIEAAKVKYPNADCYTIDNDNSVSPYICGDYINPSQYKHMPRPEIIVCRYEIHSEVRYSTDERTALIWQRMASKRN